MKSDNLIIMIMKIKKMSNEDQKKENVLFSTNVTQLMNTVKKNETQKSFNKIIQNFENLFHQELMKIKKTDKIFAT